MCDEVLLRGNCETAIGLQSCILCSRHMWGKYHLIGVRAWFAHPISVSELQDHGRGKKCVLFSHPGFYQRVHKMKLVQNNVFQAPTCPSPLALLTTVILEQLLLPDVYISQEKVCGEKKGKDKGKCFASTFPSVNAASPNLFTTTFHFCTYF